MELNSQELNTLTSWSNILNNVVVALRKSVRNPSWSFDRTMEANSSFSGHVAILEELEKKLSNWHACLRDNYELGNFLPTKTAGIAVLKRCHSLFESGQNERELESELKSLQKQNLSFQFKRWHEDLFAVASEYLSLEDRLELAAGEIPKSVIKKPETEEIIENTDEKSDSELLNGQTEDEKKEINIESLISQVQVKQMEVKFYRIYLSKNLPNQITTEWKVIRRGLSIEKSNEQINSFDSLISQLENIDSYDHGKQLQNLTNKKEIIDKK